MGSGEGRRPTVGPSGQFARDAVLIDDRGYCQKHPEVNLKWGILACGRCLAENMHPDLPSVVSARKYDDGKPRYDLIPPRALREAASVFGFGANKYQDRNWEKGLSYGRLKGALNRHVEAFWERKELDDESGLHHLGHALCCLFMLTEEVLHTDKFGAMNLDDRPE